MLTAIISLTLGALVFGVVFMFFGWVGAVIPAIFVAIISFFIISRHFSIKLESSIKNLQEDLMKGHVERAMAQLKSIKERYGRWQFFLASTIDGQIGSILYVKGQYQQAKPYLERAFVRHWVAKAMLGVIYYRERKIAKMNEIFEKATRYVKKSGLLWSLWAYCVWREGDIEKAISILSQGKAQLGDADPHLTQNLLSLQNQKRMKMKSYGEQWYQFQLEISPQQTQMKQGRVRFKNR